MGLPWVAAHTALPRPLVDVHHHWYNVELLRFWGRDALDPAWTIAASLQSMAEAGVTTAMLSVTMPGIWKSTDVARSIQLARLCNEGMAQTVRDHPGRFGFFAALPLPQIDASLLEISYALDELRADAIGLLSNYDGQYLGEARFVPVFEELNRRRAVVYVHPMAPACCTGLVPNVGPGALEAPTDTTRTIASLLASGTLSRLTAIQFLVAAGGGTLPFVGDRLISAVSRAAQSAAKSDTNQPTSDSLRAALNRLHIDTAGVTNLADWSAIMNFTTPARLLFGSDFPFNRDSQHASDAACLNELRAMQNHFGMSTSDSRDVEYGNAQRLFPARFKVAG
jgi:predicted TIM-barrel fold metal-dependent hydrolase